MIASIAAVGAMALLGQIVLRGQSTPLQDPIDSIEMRGVMLGGDEARQLSWSRVKLVLGAHRDEAEAFTHIADAAWRATSRLDRGDIGQSQPLFAMLYDELEESAGPTLLETSEGLARCNVVLGRPEAAVEPWLIALQLRRHPVETGALDVPPRLHIDDQTGLSMGIAPIWAPCPALRAFAETDLRSLAPRLDIEVLMLAVLYQRAAVSALGLPAADEPAIEAGDWEDGRRLPGIRMAWLIAESQSRDVDRRAAARADLESDLVSPNAQSEPQWTEAWRRAALGRSLLLEDDLESRDAGLIHLAHVPARFGRTLPNLAAVCLAELSIEMDRRGEHRAADRLARELQNEFPDHAASEWIQEQRSASRVGRHGANEG